jgi:hypothetical protein
MHVYYYWILISYCKFTILNHFYSIFISNPSHPENSSKPGNPSSKLWDVFIFCCIRFSACNRSSILCAEKSGNPPIEFPSGGNGIDCDILLENCCLMGLTGLNPFSRTGSIHILLSSTRRNPPSNSSFPREKIRSCHFNRSHNFFSSPWSDEVNATACSNVTKVPSRTRLFRDAINQLNFILDYHCTKILRDVQGELD